MEIQIFINKYNKFMITIEIFTPNKQFKKNNLWGTETYINQNFSSSVHEQNNGRGVCNNK